MMGTNFTFFFPPAHSLLLHVGPLRKPLIFTIHCTTNNRYAKAYNNIRLPIVAVCIQHDSIGTFYVDFENDSSLIDVYYRNGDLEKCGPNRSEYNCELLCRSKMKNGWHIQYCRTAISSVDHYQFMRIPWKVKTAAVRLSL